MTQSTVSLLPCPFCGDEADFTGCRTVQCKHCGACAANARQWNARVSTNKDETIAKLLEALELARANFANIADADDPDRPQSYRSDDREGCLDWTLAMAQEAEKAARNALTSTKKEG